ncbi:MAG: glycosyltransferase [Chitinophagaceae bacterium]|nr:glycosyltransferase [Chitinophagaceae bacterium]
MKISVCLITYNHGKYIRQAIESIISQKTLYSFELVIGEDCSNDKTRAICEEYAAKHPGIVRLLPSDKRYGMMDNFIRTMAACQGEYIAVCEGDDYWTYKQKLQLQVDFLEANKDFSVCCHDVLFEVNNRKSRSYQWDAPEESDIDYLLKRGNYLTTLSVVCRNHPDLLCFLKKFKDPPLGDYLLYVGAAQYGKIKFLKKVMGVYRVHGGGAWSQLSLEKAFIKGIQILDMLFEKLPEKYHTHLKIQFLDQLDTMIRIKQYDVVAGNEYLQNLCRKMMISPVMIEYLKFSSAEREKPSFYSKNIPFPLLVSAVKEKFRNKLLRF